ncbi:unnamed protein product [Leptosia nina]|uniref:Uncharacterized protein n=1 Tax=Leptosia nina TaxID=320188 RepID=A0AAV1IZI1_9NEOP
MPKLYKRDESPPARTVMVVAHILGLSYEPHDLNPVFRDQDTPEMVKKNPMKTIPTWEEDDFCLADSHAIIMYMLEKYGKPEHEYLYPKDQKKRATIHQRLFFDCGILFPRLRAIMAPTYMGTLTELSKSKITNLESAYEVLENYLQENLYLADDNITLADISIFTTMSSLYGIYPIDVTRFPKLKAWCDTMSEQDYNKKINELGAKEHADGILAIMNYNKKKQMAKL